MGPISTGLGIILYYMLVDDTGTRSLVELREIQDWTIKYQLQTVPGVTEVLSLGGFEKQYQVQIDPAARMWSPRWRPAIVRRARSFSNSTPNSTSCVVSVSHVIWKTSAMSY